MGEQNNQEDKKPVVLTMEDLKCAALIESLCDITVVNTHGYKHIVEAVVISALKKGKLTYSMIITKPNGDDKIESITIDLERFKLLRVDFPYDIPQIKIKKKKDGQDQEAQDTGEV